MPNSIKPRSKSQREILDEQLGSNAAEPSSIGRSFDNTSNRGYDVSVQENRDKDVSISLVDIDSSIIKYIETEIRPSIIQDGNRIKVPVMYGYPERWQTIQDKGYLREYSGRFVAPVIVLKRDSIENNRTLGTKIDPNVPQNLRVFPISYTKKNQYDNFSALTNREPVKEFRLVVVPEYLTLQYSVVIFTNHLEQNNKIIESFQYDDNSYWGEEGRFLFRARIDTYTTSTEYSVGTDRTVRTNFNITLNGYIIPDTINRDISYHKKFLSKAQLIFNLETDDNEIFTVGGKIKDKVKRQAVNFPTAPQVPNANVDPNILIYLNTNKQLTGTVTNTTTTTFAMGWLSAPSGLPATSQDNFNFFCNGQFIEKTAIVSFTTTGGVSTLVIDPVELGFSLSVTDEVVGVGKFG